MKEQLESLNKFWEEFWGKGATGMWCYKLNILKASYSRSILASETREAAAEGLDHEAQRQSQQLNVWTVCVYVPVKNNIGQVGK